MKRCTVCKKVLKLSCFHKKRSSRDGYRSSCKTCNRKTAVLYFNTERGYLTNIYNSIKQKVNKARYNNFSEEQKDKYRCHMTKEEFFKLFEEHKKIYGYTCALTGEPIFHKTTDHKNSTKSNSISVDRLDPKIGYTKENIIFVSTKANNLKNAVTKELCIAILKEYEKRGW